ncbi:hypothetical protein HYALB_00010768 [Hymenoscyphus albidus]|uniref:Cytochrome P450 n=1 Tax=Hymenoscyphus albidus TaxID=595503 RepID=A0A9N9LPH2_9HELO|nr:hypothetical protein HYALB_00010768 [Hymenoscyphus albidus]
MLSLSFSPIPFLSSGFAFWSAWWTWRFIISPKFRPKQPRELPYFVPVVGHVVAMFRDSNSFFSYAREYFGNTREIFSVTVMGQQLHIVNSPKDVLSVYKNSKGLDFNPIIKEIMASFGLRASTLGKMFDLDSNGKFWMDTAHENFKLQMHPGERLDELQTTFLGNIDKSLNWEKLAGPMVLSGYGDEVKIVSLFKWCGEVLVDSATRAFFGDSIFHIDPNLLADFFVFDGDSWKLSYQYPYFAAKDMYNAKKKGETAFTKYLALPREHREDASWVTKSIEDGIEGLGI